MAAQGQPLVGQYAAFPVARMRGCRTCRKLHPITLDLLRRPFADEGWLGEDSNINTRPALDVELFLSKTCSAAIRIGTRIVHPKYSRKANVGLIWLMPTDIRRGQG
jgi:hypothetical protein